ncbi:ferredoxin [Saccharicrinis sp. FJH62]|uniref:ferredoxin n=1 Tax=Saccharicrinis sp. FJH62 TaxID=3344657 RepID=UPI0035D50C8A
MGIQKVWKDESERACIACGICKAYAPAVFRVIDRMIVMPGVDYSLYEHNIMQALENCPTRIIRIS